ncbi:MULTISPECIES: HEPN domain-containing protein [unclassified Polaromonas]|jgi:HEPN domain-containing protein|uniref:HEPN domain-containing protein n=1 Tax=unclassified Polaromonas TaxID=2638319 RepID=UPI000BC67DC7|nr:MULTISPECIES: HEPN domain-containing protein [unclassified Polaromonas]OYY35244.1 MAG: hypothetical protein B7Y60_13010 [Polaromonas sp. 35-63-35]OYZ19151.1 MAG: hypothetical protein B7Y28_14265 [Polaromonas sp. 16-63-31]OYZ78251.1 MAG: hypothetical protein B7Y09_14045 [Polaromonas sp. 24-63-21]OZA48808.1 MAG: hypothetical protein B7X88_17905 [Polaromonas sp. 17-63-33]OZA87696.1 MAG: hypothetical protein B7X65_12470 [Polaromonas sp. 39-63-25]
MTTFSPHETSYVAWQNRATDFYLASRRLYQSDLLRPAAYCAVMALELLLKATLVYWDRKFDPEAAGHAMAKLARMVGNKVPNSEDIEIPEYFYFDQRYLTASRYPRGTKGIGIPSSFLPDLDHIYAQLVATVPFQYNTELKRILAGRSRTKLNDLRRNNRALRTLRRYLKVSIK